MNKTTQEQIAQQVGTTQSILSRIFTGRRKIGPVTAQRIAQATGAENWQQFVHMPGHELKQYLLSKLSKHSNE